ncbi:hypothetical protein GQ53DRAFT_649144, partial [Thozetella sp. PMI_491]
SSPRRVMSLPPPEVAIIPATPPLPPQNSSPTSPMDNKANKLSSLDTHAQDTVGSDRWKLEHKHDPGNPTPTDRWGDALGLPIRLCDDRVLQTFRLAVGIPHTSHKSPQNSNMKPANTQPGQLEEGHGMIESLPKLSKRRRNAVGLYQLVLRSQRRKDILHRVLDIVLYTLYIVQVILGAALTALGTTAANYPTAITLLGAFNTIIAALLALIKGQSLPERFRKDEMEFRKVRDFIEETEALMLAGVVGKNEQDAGRLAEICFKMYNSAKLSEENNRPGTYVRESMPSAKGGELPPGVNTV